MNPLLQLRDHKTIGLAGLHSARPDCRWRPPRSGRRDGLCGVTSNPTIFEKAIDGGSDYDSRNMRFTCANPNASAKELYDTLAIEDVRNATDVLRRIYESTAGSDGFVSIEPPPQLTRDTAATIREAQRLWRAVDRPNLMVKVVGTSEGITAVEALIAEGINVNITLMFSLRHYEAVAAAYIRGLGTVPPAGTRRFRCILLCQPGGHTGGSSVREDRDHRSASAQGKIAIANAKMAYKRFRESFFRGAVFGAAQTGRTRATALVGQHEHQKSPLLRCALRRRTGRSGHGEYHTVRNAGCVPRSWSCPG